MARCSTRAHTRVSQQLHTRVARFARFTQLSLLRWVGLMDEAATELPTAPNQPSVEHIVDTQLYTRDALFRACYKFTDRAYLLLRQVNADVIAVEFRAKDTH